MAEATSAFAGAGLRPRQENWRRPLCLCGPPLTGSTVTPASVGLDPGLGGEPDADLLDQLRLSIGHLAPADHCL